MNWYLKCLKEYANFNGRARRKEYWMFALFHGIITLVLALIDVILMSSFPESYDTPILYSIYILGTLIPSLAVSVRRLQDVGKGPIMLLLVLLPVIGSIWLLILTISDSQQGTNKYGPNPKETQLA